MHKKWASYSLVSVISFCFFTIIFHAVAYAQSPEMAFLPQLTQAPEKTEPTPTIFVLQERQRVAITQPTAVASSQADPTPTVYMAPTSQPTATPTIEPTATLTMVPTSTPFPTPTLQPTIAVVTDLESLFTKYSAEYGADKELLKRIARCESGFNTSSNNSDMYVGMYQFSASTWISNRTAMGLDTNLELRLSAEESIRTAAFMLARGQYRAWPNCH